MLTTCHSCANLKNPCIFETDPDPTPPYIQKQARQGPMITVHTVRNPERIAKVCKEKCSCYSEDFECSLQNIGWCDKYTTATNFFGNS